MGIIQQLSYVYLLAQVAVIVNDMAEEGIDAELVRSGGGQISQAAPRVVELSNGCICCTLRDDLLQVLRAAAGLSSLFSCWWVLRWCMDVP